MKHRLMRVITPIVCMALITAATTAYGQTSTSSLTGTVADTSGGVIPGAEVTAKNTDNGTVYTAVSNDKGVFQVPAIQVGSYTVTVSLMGFKTFTVPEVQIHQGGPTNVKATLEVGGMAETVVVKGGADIVQTQSTVVSTTMTSAQIQRLPLVTRDVLWGSVTMLPGVDISGGPRGATIAGLPSGAINITLDGVNSQDNNNRSATGCGFFSLISPRLDAVEEVTVQTATQTADSGGQGGVQIKFTTRSGTNKYQGSAYYYVRDPRFNSNYWFNNRDKAPDPATGKAPKDLVKLYQPGFRFGGPIQVPGLYDGHDKAFFFVNYEQFRQPNPVSRTRQVMTPSAMQGNYTTAGGTTINVLDLARANGQLATIDPTIGKLLADIQASTSKGTSKARSDPYTLDFNYTADAKGMRHYPTWRIDYNLTNNHRLSYTTWYQKYSSFPDTLNNNEARFPGFPVAGGQNSNRINWTAQMRSTLGKNLVNQFVTGYTKSTVYFANEVTPASFKGTSVGDQAGFNLGINAFSGITAPTATSAPSARNNPTIDVNDTVTWLKGNHSYSFGGAFTHIGLWAWNQTLVPSIGFGLATGDPAIGMFSALNLSSTDLSNAQNLYAVLTGRVNSIGNANNTRLNETTGKYEYLGPGVQRGQLHEFGFFAQDQWRWRKDLTINYGLRYELQQPFVARNDSYSTATYADICGRSGVNAQTGCNLFQPGNMPGKIPQYQNLTKNTEPYKTDYNNVAPSLGITWRPYMENGIFRGILGHEGDTVLSAAYSLAYSRGGMSDFTGIFGSNPGRAITVQRTQGGGNLILDGGSLPLLLRDSARLGPPPFADTPVYPLSGVITDEIDTFDPHLQVPYTQSWTASWQRAITRNTAFIARYVGTRSLAGFVDYNYNEINTKESGFLNEFRKAQANLLANIAAGPGAGCIGGVTTANCQNNFAYTGAPGTVPLPIFAGAYNQMTAGQATNPALYSGPNWTTATFLGFLAKYSPNPGGFASTNTTNGLVGNATFRNNLITAGYPLNLFIANPDKIGGAFVRGNGGYSRYDSMQLELRRRLANGLLVEGNYVLGKEIDTVRYSFRAPREEVINRRSGNTPGGPRHAFKANWIYEMPFGRGRHFGSNVNGFWDRVIGGWEFDGNGRVQSGQILDFGNVRLVGMTDKDLQKVYKVDERIDPSSGKQLLFILPQDIIDNTIKAFSTNPTSATGYGPLGAPTGRYFAPANSPDCLQVVNGDCAPRHHYVTGPRFVRFDLSAVKRTQLVGRSNLEFRAEFINAFNSINFNPVADVGSGLTINQVTSAYRDVNNTQDPGGRLVQFVLRVNW